jgi:hypothetical protein
MKVKITSKGIKRNQNIIYDLSDKTQFAFFMQTLCRLFEGEYEFKISEMVEQEQEVYFHNLNHK